jgi:DNA-binding response OmpR family regulator
MRILIVEDERRMARTVQRGLVEEGHSVDVAESGPDGVALAVTGDFDVILLDVMLPGFDGFEVARRLRSTGDRTPILMLTARDAAPDVVQGLDLGADDYLTKPFSFDVLLARVRAIARRAAGPYHDVLQVGDLTLDPAGHEVRRGQDVLSLTRTEFMLLEYLMRRAGRVVSREVIIEAVWGYGCDVGNNTLDVFISLLRQKIDERRPVPLIQTVRGVGYRIHVKAEHGEGP